MSSALRVPRSSAWKPTATLPPELWETRRELLQASGMLHWLHHHWNLGPALDGVGAGRGIKARVRRLAWRTLRPSMNPYFKQEQELLANLVRMVDELAKRLDLVVANQSRILGAGRTDLEDLAGYLEGLVSVVDGGA